MIRAFALALVASTARGAPLMLSPPCPPLTVDVAAGSAVFCPPTFDDRNNPIGIQRVQDDDKVHDNTLRRCTVAETFASGIGAVHQFDEATLATHRTIAIRLCARVGPATASAECVNDFGASDVVRVSYLCGAFGPPLAPGIVVPADMHP